MPLYSLYIRPDQRTQAQKLKLPIWHHSKAPTEITQTCYAQKLDALFTNSKTKFKELQKQFRDDIEYISGVVYMPRSETVKKGQESKVESSEWMTV